MSRRKNKKLKASTGSKKIGLKHIVMRGDSIDVYCYDDIDSFWGFSAQDLIEQTKGVDRSTPINFFINSYGGEVFEGMAIFNFLKSWSGKVTTICTGIAASVASYLFMAGDVRRIYDNSFVMIHNPFFAHASGDGDDLAKAADMAKRTENDFVALYASVTEQDSDKIRDWMKAETYFNANESLEYGFSTEVVAAPEVVASELSLTKLVAKLKKKFPYKEPKMDPVFKAWLEARVKPLGFAIADLDDTQIKDMKAVWEKESKPQAKKKTTATPTTPPTDPNNTDPLARSNELFAANMDRVNAINMYASDHGKDSLNEDYLKEIGIKGKTIRALASHAIRENWTIDKFELEARRSECPSTGHVGIHVRSTEINERAISAHFCRTTGIPSRKKSADGEFGTEVWFDEKTLDASDRYKDWGMLQVFDAMYASQHGSRYEGRLNTDGFIKSMRDVMWTLRADGNTSWSALNIFDDLANKSLWAAYENQATTWQKWVAPVSVNDFKTNNMYRLSVTGSYKRVGADGELQHGGFTDSKYTVAADTFGKIVGLSRRDLINDDLGALTGIMTALGAEGAKFLEELFYLKLLNSIATIFPSAGTYNNYISGSGTALGVDGLSEGEQVFGDQVDDDDAPLLVNAELLLVGTNNKVVANEIYSQSILQGLQTANAKKRPDGNPHVGKFEPVVSPYLNNTNLKQRSDFIGKSSVGTAIPGQSSTHWMLLPRPTAASGAIVTGAFLNGVQRPVVAQGDPNFDVLGLLWRAYHDVGGGIGDPKLGVYSKGAA